MSSELDANRLSRKPVARSPAGYPIRWLVVAAAGFALGVSSSYARAGEPQRLDAARLMNELMTGRERIGGPFSLTDQRGQQAGPAMWRGKIVLLYFGYMSCPDACPTDLAAIAAAIDDLGSMGSEVQPVFITLDPSRDKPERIGRYAESFHPRFAALSGSEEQTREVAAAYRVYFEKVPTRGTNQYSIDHTSFTYVLDADGNFAGFFPPGTSGTRIAERVRAMLTAR
jgi:cytochrome oxidase Cu insertion factor (SCO1/SenC/PrrC family)